MQCLKNFDARGLENTAGLSLWQGLSLPEAAVFLQQLLCTVLLDSVACRSQKS